MPTPVVQSFFSTQFVVLKVIDLTCVEEGSVFDEASDPFSGQETAYVQEKFIAQELGS